MGTLAQLPQRLFGYAHAKNYNFTQVAATSDAMSTTLAMQHSQTCCLGRDFNYTPIDLTLFKYAFHTLIIDHYHFEKGKSY